jgi:hypothetical protein
MFGTVSAGWRKPLVPDVVALPDFQRNSPSSAALLDRSPDNVYTPYVCNPLEAPLVRCWSSSASTTTRPRGWLRLSSSTMFMQERSRAQSSRVWILSLLQLLFSYVDRWCAMGVGFFFCFLLWTPTVVSNQSRSMHSCTGTVRTHRGCRRWFSYCYPFICICSCLRYCWIASGPQPTLRIILHETGSTTDVRLASYKWLGGCQFLLFSGHGFCNGGPLAGV